MHITGADLREAREAAGLTQQVLADALGVSRQSVVTWEQRATIRPDKAESYLRVVSELASRDGRQQ